MIFKLLGIAYIAFTLWSFKEASSPVNSCDPLLNNGGDLCLSPLVSLNETLSLELWILTEILEDTDNGVSTQENSQKRNQIRSRYGWQILDSCTSLQMKLIELLHSETVFDSSGGNNNNNYNCTLHFPDFARKRQKHDTSKGTLKAKFILRKSSPEVEGKLGMIVAEAPFDLTRLVPKGNRISALLSSVSHKNDATAEDYVPHFKYRRQGIVLRFVRDESNYGYPYTRGDGLQVQMDPFHRQYYRPIFYVDDLALRHSSQIELGPSGEGRPPVSLHIKFSTIHPIRDVIIRQVNTAMHFAESILHPTELDEIRYFISDERIYRFLLTQLITFIHIWLDYLAFKDEIGFYIGRTDMTGLSISSVTSRFICELIIFLYLLDGGGTSWVILFSIGSGVIIEAWKVIKVLKPERSNQFPFMKIRDPSRLSQMETLTVNYDRIGTTYLSLILYPIIVGTALYARTQYEYSSWYSWLISNLANAVYTFGFISLCPQLYVNYRLKSVAHLPTKVFIYKIFNTFIDDVFAFLIQSPLKHKLMTLRDDIVFVIFLFQAYIYQIDKNRPNEYGFVYEAPPKGSTRIENDQSDEIQQLSKNKVD